MHRSIIIYDYFTQKQIGHVSYYAFLYILQYLVQVFVNEFAVDFKEKSLIVFWHY